MRCATLSDFFSFRKECLCKTPLIFAASSKNIDNLHFNILNFNDFIHIRKNNEIKLAFSLADFYNKYKIIYNLVFTTNNSQFRIEFLDKNKNMEKQFINCIKKHLTIHNQFLIGLTLTASCPNKKCDYKCKSMPIYFDFIKSKLFPFYLAKESYLIKDSEENRVYSVETDICLKNTIISFIDAKPNFILGEEKKINIIDSNDFINYPLDPAYLLKKIKIIATFS